MRAAHYCLALVPLAAVWLYVIGQSGRQLGNLIEDIAGAGAPAAARDEEPAPLRASAAANAPRTAPAEPQSAAAEPAEISRYEPPPVPSYAPAPLPGPYAAEPAESPAADHHPEIVDAAMRRRLQPAWDD